MLWSMQVVFICFLASILHILIYEVVIKFVLNSSLYFFIKVVGLFSQFNGTVFLCFMINRKQGLSECRKGKEF